MPRSASAAMAMAADVLAAPSAAPPRSARGQSTSERPPSHSSISGLTVLLADDDDDFRSITADVLMRLQVRVVEAHDGREALRLAEREHPDIILLDQRMPGLTGTEVAARLAQAGTSAAVVLVTAARNIADMARSVSLRWWLQKPFSLDDLQDVLVQARRGRGT